MLNIGIIGAGDVARRYHIPGWSSISGARIEAVADIDGKAAAALAAETGIPRVFTDHRDLLRLGLDAVDVCTPNLTHAGIVGDALAAGKHVFCEKPLAVSAADVKRIGGLADSKGLKLMTGQHHRFGAAARAAKRWAEAGNLGKVYHARVRANRRAWLPTQPGFIDRSLSGGGPCLDIGVHALDMALWLMGFPDPALVTGTAKVNFAKGRRIPGRWGEWDRERFTVEDFAAGFVRFRDGATLSLESAWLGHQPEDEDLSCQWFGLEGGLQWPSGRWAACPERTFRDGLLEPVAGAGEPHADALRAFCECIAAGSPSPVDWRESLKVIAILEAVYLSQARGREVEISLEA